MTSHPPVSLLFFLDKCATGAIHTAPVTAAICSSKGGVLRMGRAWENSAMALQALGLQLPRLQPFGRSSQEYLLLHQGAAATADQELRARLRHERSPFRMHGEGDVSMAQLGMPTSFTVALWMLGKSSMRDAVASSFAWNWSNTPALEVPPDVRGATARHDRTPSARLLNETLEIIHAHSGQWLDKMCTLRTRRSLV